MTGFADSTIQRGCSRRAKNGEGLPLQEVWDRGAGCCLSPAATNTLRLSERKRATGPKPLHPDWSLLPEVPVGASAHGHGEEIIQSKAHEPPTRRNSCAHLRAQEDPDLAVAGSLRALSAGNAGEHPAASGARRLPVLLFAPEQPLGQKRALPRRAAPGEAGEGGQVIPTPSVTRGNLSRNALCGR